MTNSTFKIETLQVDMYVNRLLMTTDLMLNQSVYNYVKVLTNFAYKGMCNLLDLRTKKSTGNIKRSIAVKIKRTNAYIEGTVTVGKNNPILYQRALEYGIKIRKTIVGRPLMAFKTSKWPNAKIAPNSKGYYVFHIVKRGRFKGVGYVRDTYSTTKLVAEKLYKTVAIPEIKRVILQRG